MTEALDSFEDAAELALAEIEEATSVDPAPALPAEDEEAQDESGQAESGKDEQAASQEQEAQDTEDESEGEEPEEESLFSGIDTEEVDDSEADGPVSLDDLGEEALINLGPGHEPKTLRELRDSGLRLDDYTRKTQEVSEQRKTNERAIKFWEALQNEPMAVAKQIAMEAGLIEEGATPVKAVDFAPVRTAEEVEAEVEKRVEERLAEHPDVVEAKRASAMQTINAEFDRLEKAYDTSLNEASRRDILVEAKRRGVADLELVTESMLAKRERQRAKRQELKDAAPSRATGQSTSEVQSETVSSFEEAAQRAVLELGLE